MRLWCAIVLATFVSVNAVGAQSELPADHNVTFKIAILGEKHSFQIGETIPLELNFSSSIPNRYQVDTAQYDRSGRMEMEHFTVSPADGAVDPLARRKGAIGGGLRGFQFLKNEPWTIQLNLNEWVRFIRPGTYRVSTTSKRIGIKDPSNPLGSSGIVVEANDLTIQITPATRAWQRATLRGAIKTLDEPIAIDPQKRDAAIRGKKEAMETLRFLATPEAIRELAKRMRSEDSGGLDYICLLGLIGAPDREIALQAMEDALADPDHPIDQNFLYALRTVSSEVNEQPTNWQEEQKRVVEQLVAALPTKRGKALSVSLSTAVNEVWNGAAVSQRTNERLVRQLIAMFDQLPDQQKTTVLKYRWDKIAGPAMLPILQRYAENYRDFPLMNEATAFEALQLSASALQHWYELDPAAARPAVIREITRPRPRFDARVLGLLPDKTLPEVDSALAEHLTATDDFNGLANISSLIARYSTDSILPEVLGKLDPSIGKWACAVQEPLLAYVLRVNPELARPRIEKAIAARGKGFSACNHELFQGISQIRYDPVLEELAIHSLDDPDPQVAATAATTLGNFGTPAVEAVLWDHYTAWASKWRGQESQLALTFADGVDDRLWQRGLGENLMLAVVTGRSWLTDKPKIRRLDQLTTVVSLRQKLEPLVNMWEKSPPLPIGAAINPPDGFSGGVAQYRYSSMADMEAKLAQFPPGTQFVLEPGPRSAESDKAVDSLRAVMQRHGLVLLQGHSNP